VKRTTEERAQAIVAAYQNGMPIFEMHTTFGGSTRTIYQLLDRYGIARRPDERPWRRVALNEGFFDVLTPDSAWILGLWLADGSIDQRSASKRALIGFADEELLRDVHRIMDAQAAITPSKDGRFWSFRVTSNLLCDRLTTLGVIQPKENRRFVPRLEDSLMHHLVRGIFDGDGHVSSTILTGYSPYCNVQIAYPNIDFLQDLAHFLQGTTGIDTRIAPGDGCWQLRMHSKEAIELLRWMYQDSEGRRLDRKYQRALAFIDPTSSET